MSACGPAVVFDRTRQPHERSIACTSHAAVVTTHRMPQNRRTSLQLHAPGMMRVRPP